MLSKDNESRPLASHLQRVTEGVLAAREERVRQVNHKASLDLYISASLLYLHFDCALSWREISEVLPYLSDGGHAHKIAYRAVSLSGYRANAMVHALDELLGDSPAHKAKMPVLPPLLLEGGRCCGV